MLNNYFILLAGASIEPLDNEYFANLLINITLFLGVGLLIAWQIRQPMLSSLDRCPVRRHRFPLFFAFFQLFIWIFALMTIGLVLKSLLKNKPEKTIQDIQSIALGILEIGCIGFFILLANFGFVRGLKGFGLRLKTIPKDLFWAAIHLITVYPVIVFALYATIMVAKYLTNGKFEFPVHQTLIEITNTPDRWIQAYLIFMAVVIVPFFEEILFRGMVQSTLRGYLNNPWLAIMVTSIMFSACHPGPHFFGILALSVCLGYAYEKSGSLFRSIFIHVLFNAINVAASILS